MPQAVIYTRFRHFPNTEPTDAQIHREISKQETELQDFASFFKLNVVGTFSDTKPGSLKYLSGFRKLKNELFRDHHQQNKPLVLIADWSVITNDPFVAVRINEKFAQRGITIVSVLHEKTKRWTSFSKRTP